MSPLLSINRSESTPLQEQIYQQFRAAILTGRFSPGTRVPSSRALASELEISRNTAILAYDRLHAEGYLTAEKGSGTFVSPKLPEELLLVKKNIVKSSPLAVTPSERARRMISYPTTFGQAYVDHFPFRPSLPAYEAFPLKLFSKLMAQSWSEATPRQLGYGQPAGYLPLREAVASYLGEHRGVLCSPEQIIITIGSQQAILLAAQVLMEPGDDALVEDPGYLAARSALLSAGAILRSIPVDDEGAKIPNDSTRAKVAYVTPSFQYPTGAIMSLPRRLAWLEWARRSNGWILEDDYDSEFRYTGPPLPALQGMQADARVIYIGTFSKVLLPGLRLGYLVAPDSLVDAFTAVRRLSGLHSQQIDQVAVARFIDEGHFNRHLRRMRVLYAERQDSLLQAIQHELSDFIIAEPRAAGMHLPTRIVSRHSAQRISERAERSGLVLVPLSRFCMHAKIAEGFLLGYTSFSPRKLRQACVRLREVFNK